MKCEFCLTGDATLTQVVWSRDRTDHRVVCRDCGEIGPRAQTEATAIDAWIRYIAAIWQELAKQLVSGILGVDAIDVGLAECRSALDVLDDTGRLVVK